MAKNRGYWKPNRVVFRKKKPSALDKGIDEDSRLAIEEKSLAIQEAGDVAMTAMLRFRMFFRRIWWFFGFKNKKRATHITD